MASEQPMPPEARRMLALGADIPHLYANGFAISLTPADAAIVLECNGQAIASLNMSYTAAKTLAVKLGATIGTLESATGRPMLTTDEVDAQMSKAEKKT